LLNILKYQTELGFVLVIVWREAKRGFFFLFATPFHGNNNT